MRQVVFILSFFVFKAIAQTNANLQGTWVKYNIEMKDGSKILERAGEEPIYMEFRFKKNEMCINSSASIHEPDGYFKYTLQENLIKTSGNFTYIIERNSADTLVISEKMISLPIEKQKRFFFVNEKHLQQKRKSELQDAKDIIATPEFSPKLKTKLIDKINQDRKDYQDFEKIEGFIVVSPNLRKVETEITYCEKGSSSISKKISKIINNTFKDWDLSGFESYETIKIPFFYSAKSIGMFITSGISYYTDGMKKLNPKIKSSDDDEKKSEIYFEKGLKSYNKKNYTQAIDYFTKSYSFDPINIDALYNRATIYYEMGELEKACQDWKQLSDLGQMKAKGLIENYCK